MADQEQSGAEFAEPSSKLVLIVDDDGSLVDMLTMGISGQGFKVETASNAQEAMGKLSQRAPDLIITDLMMPGGGGYDLLKELQTGDAARTPVIVATARQIDESTERMIRSEANVVEFIRKPIKMAQLYGTLHRTLKTRPPAPPPRKGISNQWGPGS